MSDAADGEPTPADDRLLAELAAMLGRDMPPDGLVERATGLLAWIDVDHELAQLLDEPDLEAAGIRGAPTANALATFEVGDGSVVVELTFDDGRLIGQLLAGAPTRVSLERLDGDVVEAVVDEVGRFVFAEVRVGPARLRWSTSSQRPVLTDWFMV
jgi:hypothetical protein